MNIAPIRPPEFLSWLPRYYVKTAEHDYLLSMLAGKAFSQIYVMERQSKVLSLDLETLSAAVLHARSSSRVTFIPLCRSIHRSPPKRCLRVLQQIPMCKIMPHMPFYILHRVKPGTIQPEYYRSGTPWKDGELELRATVMRNRILLIWSYWSQKKSGINEAFDQTGHTAIPEAAFDWIEKFWGRICGSRRRATESITHVRSIC